MMARKTLLTESEIRRFMKLANMGPVGGKKMEGMYPSGGRDEPRGAPDGGLDDIDAMADPEGEDIEDLEGDFGPPEDELAVDDVAMDDMSGDAGDGMMVSVDDFMSAFETALGDVTGQEVDSVVDLASDEEAGLEDLEGGDETLDGPEAEPEPEVDVGAVEVEDEFAMQERLVKAVASRVAKRLVKENRKTALTDELTDRIFQRLTQRSR
jgi:hypothetical protein|tara:strand:- start:7718 stop:8347 length:630 start_codon:yes stop_codon:yes gene_type:complete